MCVEVDNLIAQARAGNQHALAQLFEQHQGRLARMVDLRMDRRVQARVAVSDVLQEAYVDLAQQLPNYAKDPKLPFFLWLRRITGQRLAKIHRQHLGQAKRNVSKEVPLDQRAVPGANSGIVARELVGRFTSAAGHAIREETRAKVQEVLEHMPANDREMIALRNVERLSNEEIASLLGLSGKAASMRYTRALLRLKDVLTEIPGMLD